MKITKAELKQYTYAKIYNHEGVQIRIDIRKNNELVDQVEQKRFSLVKYLEKKGIFVDENEDLHIDILKLAMIHNVDFPVVYTMTAPYTHEYCISSHQCNYIEQAFCQRVTSKDWYNELPIFLYRYMLRNHPDFDYEQLLNKIKLVIKNNEVKDVTGSTYRGQPTSDTKLQALKYKLVNHLPLVERCFSEQDELIKNDFERIYNQYLKDVK